jgi:hypothetical protein
VVPLFWSCCSGIRRYDGITQAVKRANWDMLRRL